MKREVRTIQRTVAVLSVVAALFCFTSIVGGVSVAHAESCTKELQARTLMTDDPTVQETQFCLSGTWTTTSYFSTKPDYKSITETVTDPSASKYSPNVSDFFDLKKIDPFAIVQAFKDLADGVVTLTDDQKLQQRLQLARQKPQALLNRQNTDLSDGCKVRSLTYSRAYLDAGSRWLPPKSTALPGQPTQITYAFASDVPDATKVAVLNALDQYPDAVRYQDASFRYPEQIVPHDPSDSRPPTITFQSGKATGKEDGSVVAAWTTPILLSGGSGSKMWVSGVIGIVEGQATPSAIGHEIGHVLGLDHTMDKSSTMYAYQPSGAANPWAPAADANTTTDEAFSPCMFLPPITPNQ